MSNATIEKLERLANDKGATAGERANAKAAVEKLKAKRSKKDPVWESFVTEGKAAIKDRDNARWRLGELASRVEGKYGDSSLKKYAQELETNESTLKNYRSVYIAWKDQKDPRGSYSILRELAPIEDPKKRIAVLEKMKKNNEMTSRKAYEYAKRYKPPPKASEIRRYENRAARAGKSKGTDSAHHYGEAVSILKEFLTPYGNVRKLIHSQDFGSVHGTQARREILKALYDLRARVDAEISRLETGNKLN